jgi:DNA modification methylase
MENEMAAKIDVGSGSLWNGDCLEMMADIPGGSVDMVVTSPPYDNLRTYNGSLTDWTFEKFSSIAHELTRCVKQGGVIVWNVGDATVKGSETGSSFRQGLYFKDVCGLNLHDTMIWEKPNFLPLTHNRYEQCFEYMFILTKGRPHAFHPIKDKQNIGAGRKVTGSRRDAGGKTVPLNGLGTSISEYGMRPNIWKVETAKGQKTGHPAPFPVPIAQDHIISWSNPGDLVLDPFSGSGTTAIAAERSGRRWLCIERDPTYYAASLERIKNHIAETAETSRQISLMDEI